MKFSHTLFLILYLHISIAQSVDRGAFIFGHSLIDHGLPINPPPGDETKIPHWIFLLAQEAGNTYAAGGQYGFLPQHANLPPISQWGYDLVPGVWDSDIEPFSDAVIDHIMITAGNFVQWQGPEVPYYGGDGIQSPLTATIDIMDWVATQKPGTNVYIYENWPDMAPYLSTGFPPDATEWNNYNNFTVGEFHSWWISYHDMLLQSRPDLQPRMIPVGPIIEGLLSETPLNSIPVTELYEDDAPHGLPTIYFLAGLITYMAIYEEMAPLSFSVPPIIHSSVATNYQQITQYIWNELLNFNDSNGNSRVFLQSTVPVEWVEISAQRQMNHVKIKWYVGSEYNTKVYEIERSDDGINYTLIGQKIPSQSGGYTYMDVDAPTHTLYYRIKDVDLDDQYSYSPVAVSGPSDQLRLDIFPNPSDGMIRLSFKNSNEKNISLHVYASDGNVVHSSFFDANNPSNNLDLSHLMCGVYLIQVVTDTKIINKKLLITK